MMKLFFTLTFGAVGFICYAQIQLPNLSPEGKIIQTIGYTHFIIRYDRPAARGRKIFGNLVPFNKLWRTGAGKCTTIQFDQPVKIGGQIIAAGIYALATIPSLKEWTILLNSDTSKIYGEDSDYDKRNEVARFSAASTAANRFCESLTIDLDIADNNGVLYLSWENTKVQILIDTNSSALAENKIKQALIENPNNAEVLSSAAYYYEMNNQKIPEAYAYIKKAMTLREDRWYYRLAVNLLVKMKSYKEAIAMAQQGISFLERTHPAEWQTGVQDFKNDIRKIAAMK
jgi:tetratricopeptide (TPR) repeat protein